MDSRRTRRTLLAVASALTVALGACSYESRAVAPLVPPQEVESSTVYAADGTLMYTFHAEENRKVVALEEIPLHVRLAVLAIEDERFYRHGGVDARAILRALRTNTEAGEIEEGGSTITQQYVKQVLLQDDSQTIGRKLEEASMAVQLERRYSKDRILELYLNTIYFGNGAYGIEAAAQQYFGKSVKDVSLAEAALLAGLIQRPGTTDPYRAPEAAIARRDLVLARMLENGFATTEQVEGAQATPLQLGTSVTPAAERYPAASLVAVQPSTGYVRAMVGGRDFFGDSDIAKLNLATQARRQAGSSFKPLVLATALTQGVDPLMQLPAPECITIPIPGAPPWRPCNYGGGAGGTVTIAEGTVRSYNTLYAQLIMQVGPAEAMEAAASYGIRSPLEPVPSAVLGTNVVTGVDMVSAYATFANRGIRVPPVLVTRITRADGTVLFQHEHKQEKVLEPEVADTLTSILQQVIERGTGTRAKLGRPAAGKTGTTDDWKDAWFAGYTPDLAAAVWVGFPQLGPDGQLIPMQPPATPIRVTGGSYPAEIWRGFMERALEGVEPSQFQPPPTTTTTAAGGGSDEPTGETPRPAGVVPAVVGDAVTDASAKLSAAGFVVRRVPAPSGGQEGTVVAQSPPPGGRAPLGSTVVLEVVGG